MDPKLYSKKEPTILDLDYMTPEQWRSMIRNRVVEHKDVLVGDIKKTVINEINKCMDYLPGTATAADLQKYLVDIINKNEFRIEYQTFLEGIVGSTFEYVCQFIIKNSMDNIKRTQNSLYSSSFYTGTDVMKEHNDESLQERFQICNSSVSNNNVSDSINENQIRLLNLNKNICQNDENNDKVIVRKEQNIPIHLDKYPPSKSNIPLPTELQPSNEIDLRNNYVPIAQSQSDIEENENTDASLMSIAATINCNMSFSHSDDFDTSFSENIRKSETSSPLLEQCEDRNKSNDEPECEYEDENVNGMNGLKILEKLVSIEHSKLENINYSVEKNDSPQPISNLSENKLDELSTNKKKLIQKKIKESKKEVNEIPNEDMCTPNIMEPKTDRLNDKNKSKKRKNTNKDETPAKKRKNKSKNQKNLEIIDLNSEQINQNISSTIGNSSFFNTKKASEVGINGETIGNVIDLDKKRVISPNSFDTSAAINKCDDKDMDNLRIKSPVQPKSTKKPLNYKKMYEKARKNLFSPDFITKQSPTKDLTIDSSVNKECSVADKDKCVKKSVMCRINLKNLPNNKKMKNQNPSSSKTLKSTYNNSINEHNEKLNAMTKDNVSNSSNQTSFSDTKVTDTSDSDQFKTVNIEDNINGNKDLTETTDSQDINASESLRLSKDNLPSTETNTKDIQEFDSLPNWLKLKCIQLNIKPMHIVLEDFRKL